MATETDTTASAETISVTVHLPRDVHAAAVALAKREDSTVDDLVVDLLRREAARADEQLLEEAIARAGRGEGAVVTDEMRRTLRSEIEAGTEADEALKRAGL